MASATVRRAPYKDFLQPALHRRFSSAATFLLALTYVLAIILGDFNSFIWSWFPIGPVGLRTLWLFSSALAVIVLRISQYHVGVQASPSPLWSAVSNCFTLQFVEAWLSYAMSSGFFGLIFLWSSPDSADLQFIKIMSGDRARLNPKPVFLTFYLAVSAGVQALAHITRDEDRIVIDVSRLRNGANKGAANTSSSYLQAALLQLPAIFVDAFIRATGVWTFAFILYSLFFQKAAWSWAMAFFRPFYNLPKNNILPSDAIFRFSLISRSIWAGFLITVIWMISNHVFSVFMVKEPLKNGKPLTTESKDPNGSLLNGLKSKKMPIRCFAIWELAHIARDFEDRRKAIFEDIDRKDGPMWAQVYVICIDVVKSLEKRIDDYGKPAPVPAPVVAQPEPAAEFKARTATPVKDDPIFRFKPANKSVRGEVEKAVGQVARDPGHSPVSQLSPKAIKTLRETRDKVLSKEVQEALTPPKIRSLAQSWALAVVKLDYVGWIFRQNFRQTLAVAVLGAPYAEASHHINAVETLSALAVHSLTEDKFGNVHRDIATIVRTFTMVIRKLEEFKAAFPLHWTDVNQKKDAPEVDAVIAALKSGLSDVVREFEPYALDLRLSRTDLRLAKEASAAPKVVEEKEGEGEENKENGKKDKGNGKEKMGERKVDNRWRQPEMTQVRQ